MDGATALGVRRLVTNGSHAAADVRNGVVLGAGMVHLRTSAVAIPG